MKFATLLLLSFPAWAQIERPVIGMMLDQKGALRPVFGVPGSATLGDPVLTEVLSSACSAHLCLAKTDAAIISLPDGVAVPAPPGPAMFALDGDQAYIYFPESQGLGRWHDGTLDRLDVMPDFLGNGAMRSITGAVIFATDDGLRIFRDDGTESDLALPGITRLLALGEGYIEVVAANGIYGLRVDSIPSQLFLLPGTDE